MPQLALAAASDLDIALTGRDGTGAAGHQFFGASSVVSDHPVLLDIILPAGSWQLAARPQGGWQETPANLWKLRLVLLAAGTLIVFPTFLAGRHSAARQAVISKLRYREAELEAVSRRLEIGSQNLKSRHLGMRRAKPAYQLGQPHV